MVELTVERTIAAPADEVYAWLIDPANLTRAPLALTARWTSGNGEAGSVREVLALGLWAREKIVAADPPHHYEYLILTSVPAIDHRGGTITLTAGDDGTTAVRWTSDYTHPARGGGKPMAAITSRLLPRSFAAVLAACAHDLEGR